MTLKKIVGYAFALFISIVILFQWIYLPWNLTWGATEEEVNRHLPGDDIVESSSFITTRAVSINTSPENIWPWIIQIGYKRAGFYSYDILDNDGIPSADHIIPKYQDLMVGDQIPISENSSINVLVLEPPNNLLLASHSESFTWLWSLNKIDQQHTRLITRIHHRIDSNIINFLWESFEFVMMRKCMLGIKHRAESLTGISGSLFGWVIASTR